MNLPDRVGDLVTRWVVLRRRFWKWLTYRPLSDDDLSMIAFYEMMGNPTISSYSWEYNYLQEKWIEIRRPMPTWIAFDRLIGEITEGFTKFATAAKRATAPIEVFGEQMQRSASQVRRGWNEQ